MEQFLRIGVITQTHGIKGEVKVYPTTDSPRRFCEVKHVFLRHKNKEIETEITGVKFIQNLAIVHFACFDNPEDAAQFKTAEVYIRREDAQALGEDEYYIADLIGCKVVVEEASVPAFQNAALSFSMDETRAIGTVKDVLQTGANDVFIVTTDKNEILVPKIKDCIVDIDIVREQITIRLMAGLADLWK